MKNIWLSAIFFVSSLWAVEWTGYGVEEVFRTNKGVFSAVTLRDQKGFVFTVENEELLKEEQVKPLLQTKDVISSWTKIIPERLVFFPTEMGIEMLVLPKVAMYREQNLVPYIPSGLRFFWRVGLSYDFRMMISTNLVRIRGIYENEEELLAHMNRAVRYPLLYMSSESMDILLQKLENIEERVVLLEAENSSLKKLWLAYLNRNIFGQLRPISDTVIENVVALKRKNPHWSRKDIYEAVKKDIPSLSQKEVDLIFLVYFFQY